MKHFITWLFSLVTSKYNKKPRNILSWREKHFGKSPSDFFQFRDNKEAEEKLLTLLLAVFRNKQENRESFLSVEA